MLIDDLDILKKRQELLYAQVSKLAATIAQGDNFVASWERERPMWEMQLKSAVASHNDVNQAIFDRQNRIASLEEYEKVEKQKLYKENEN